MTLFPPGYTETTACPQCAEEGDCKVGCPLRLCGECAGNGFVIDFSNPLKREPGHLWYGTKPCPKGCTP